MGLLIHLEGITQDHFETLYACARGKASPSQGIAALEDVKEHLIGFTGAYRAITVEPSMHRTYVSLTKNMTRLLAQVEQYVHDMQVADSQPSAEGIERSISSLQLIVNGLRQVASTIDKAQPRS